MAQFAVTSDSLLYVLRWGSVDFQASGEVPPGFSQVALNENATPVNPIDRYNGVTAGEFFELSPSEQETADRDIQKEFPAVAIGNLAGFKETSAVENMGVTAYTLNIRSGFDNTTDSVLTFTPGSRTFTISPTTDSFRYVVRGQALEEYAAKNVVWPDIEGAHYFYFDGTQTLVTTMSPGGLSDTMIRNYALIASLYWDQTAQAILYKGELRHPYPMDEDVRVYLHNVFGARWRNGLALTGITADGSGNADSDAQLGVQDGEFFNDNMLIDVVNGSPQTISPIGQIPVYYIAGPTNAPTLELKPADSLPLIYSGTAGYVGANGRAPFNENTGAVWQLTQVSQSNFFLVHLFATPGIETSMIAVQGQAEYTSIGAARSGADTELNSLVVLGLLAKDFIPVASVIYQTSTGYSNTPKARIRSTDSDATYVDWRSSLRFGGSSAIVEHDQLAARDNVANHLQYLAIRDEVRPMQIDLDMGGNDVLNPGQVDGRDVSADGATLDSHVANTSDPHATLPPHIAALDPHTQYHNDTRGDARYFPQTSFLVASTGALDAGKPIKLDAGGKLDASLYDASDISHGLLSGLGVDDHTQYHNDARGDSRYFTRTLFVATSVGAADAGKPIKLDTGGKLDPSLYDFGDISHASLSGLGADDHAQYLNNARGDARYFQKTEFISGSTGIPDAGKPVVLGPTGLLSASMIGVAGIDHGELGGLGGDDHTQYHNDTRGDIRYFQQSQFLSASAGVADAGKPIQLDTDGRLAASFSAKGLWETGGPTALTMGNVADGHLLSRSGATVVGTQRVSSPGAETIGNLASFTGSMAIGDAGFAASKVLRADATVPMETAFDLATNDILNFLQVVGGAPNATLKRFFGQTLSAGFVGEPGTSVVLPNGTGFDIAEGVGLFHVSTAIDSDIQGGRWPAQNNNPIGIDEVQWVGVEWNGGAPQVTIRPTDTFDFKTDWPLAIVRRDASGTYIVFVAPRVSNATSLIEQRFSDTQAFARSEGLNLATSGPGNLNVLRTAGQGWLVLNNIAYSAFDTSGADTMERYFGDDANGWNVEVDQTQYEDQSYYDGIGGLLALPNGRYGVRWFYLDLASGAVAMIYGTSNVKTQSEAALEAAPASVPPRLDFGTRLLGRIIVLKSAGAVSVSDVWGTSYSTASAGGESNSGANLGTGSGLYQGKSGTVLEFRGVLGSSGIVNSIVGDDVQLSGDALLPRDGSRAMTGVLNMGSQNIASVGTIGGVNMVTEVPLNTTHRQIVAGNPHGTDVGQLAGVGFATDDFAVWDGSKFVPGQVGVVTTGWQLLLMIPDPTVVGENVGTVVAVYGHLPSGSVGTIERVRLDMKNAPASTVVIDVNKGTTQANATTIFTTQSNRPQVAASALSGFSGTPNVTTISRNDIFTVSVDTAASSVAGTGVNKAVYVLIQGTSVLA